MKDAGILMPQAWRNRGIYDMATFAVIQTGGKQYIVREGQELKIEKLDQEVGSNVDFDVLLVSDEEGTTTEVGTPILSGKKVSQQYLNKDALKRWLSSSISPSLGIDVTLGTDSPSLESRLIKSPSKTAIFFCSKILSITVCVIK